MNSRIIPVILCGGSGSRLWPLSQHNQPKQFLRLNGDQSLLQMTALRALSIPGVAPGQIIAITGKTHAAKVRKHLLGVDPMAANHLISEEKPRNTALAVATALSYASRVFDKGDILAIMPSDGHFQNIDHFRASLVNALEQAKNGRLSLIGMKPDRAETGYGYIRYKPGEDARLPHDSFVEKPSLQDAESMIASGDYLWNSGLCVASIQTLLEEFALHSPDYLNIQQNPEMQVPALPFDKAVLEKSSNLSVTPCESPWCDIGTWQGLWQLLEQDIASPLYQEKIA